MLNFGNINLTTNRTIYFGRLTTNFSTVYSEKAFVASFRFPIRRCFGSAESELQRLFSFKPKMEKKCFKCDEIKPLTDFYKHSGMSDGRLNKCKECSKTDVKENYRKNFPHYQEYELARQKQPHRIDSRRQYLEHWQATNPEKRQAHILVGNAVRDGKLIKQPCEVCGSAYVHGHHDDYSEPLKVRWLCPKHHKEHHQNLGVVK